MAGTRGLAGQSARLGLLAAGLVLPQSLLAADPSPSPGASAPTAAAPSPDHLPRRGADFIAEPASGDARRVADWVVVSGDNRGLPFVIVDKVEAKVFAFDGQGLLRGAAPALLGLAKGDETPPGIGERRLADIAPGQRITPAGRFEAGLGRDLGPNDVLWVDYEAAISLHRVITTNPVEQRLKRLTSPSALDNRISYGCINVPVLFYEGVVRPLFRPANGIVYILPETRSLGATFAVPASPGEARSDTRP